MKGGMLHMTKTDKELAVDIAKAVIEANTVQLQVASNGGARQTHPISNSDIQSVIKATYTTLQGLSEKE